MINYTLHRFKRNLKFKNNHFNYLLIIKILLLLIINVSIDASFLFRQIKKIRDKYLKL